VTISALKKILFFNKKKIGEGTYPVYRG